MVRPNLPVDRLRPAPASLRRDPRPAILATLAALFLAVLLAAGGGAAGAARLDAPHKLLDAAKATLAAPERTQTRGTPTGDGAGDDALAPVQASAVRRPARVVAAPPSRHGPAVTSRQVRREARAPPARDA